MLKSGICNLSLHSKSELIPVLLNWIGLIIVMTLNSAGPSVAANEFTLKVLNDWVIDCGTFGAAVKTDDGFIFVSTRAGTLIRLNSKVLHKVASITEMEYGAGRCLMTVRDKQNKQVVLVGHWNGFNFYGDDGKEIGRSIEDRTFLEPGIVWNDQVFFVADEGTGAQFSIPDLRMVRPLNRGPLPGSLTGPPSLMRGSKTVLIFGTKGKPDPLTRVSKYHAVLMPITGEDAGCTKSVDLSSNDGKLIFKPTVVNRKGSDIAFMVTDRGKVITTDGVAVSTAPIIDLRSQAWSPVVPLRDERLCVFIYDKKIASYVRAVFSYDGRLLEQSTVQDIDGKLISAEPCSVPSVFIGPEGQNYILQGFVDRHLRLIDVGNGVTKASLKTVGEVIREPAKLDISHFLVTEEVDREFLPLMPHDEPTKLILIELRLGSE